jgi:hypothetical protein
VPHGAVYVGNTVQTTVVEDAALVVDQDLPRRACLVERSRNSQESPVRGERQSGRADPVDDLDAPAVVHVDAAWALVAGVRDQEDVVRQRAQRRVRSRLDWNIHLPAPGFA